MRVSLPIALTLIFIFIGCKAIDELTFFDIDYNYTFTLPAFNGLVIPEEIESNDVENNTENTFDNNDTRKDLVERATLQKFNVRITEPTDGSFNFVNKVEIFVKTSELSEKLIAWKYDIPQDIGNYIELDTTSDDLKKYLTSNTIKVRLKTISNGPITEDHTMDLEASVEVDAKILGI